MSVPTPEPVLLDPGDPIPAELPLDAAVYQRVDLNTGGIIADALGDGCLGRHYPETNPACTTA